MKPSATFFLDLGLEQNQPAGLLVPQICVLDTDHLAGWAGPLGDEAILDALPGKSCPVVRMMREADSVVPSTEPGPGVDIGCGELGLRQVWR